VNRIAQALDGLDRLIRWLAIGLAAAIVAILTAQIFFRYILNDSIVWSEEVSTWCMVWLVFIGSASIMHRWDHVHVPLLLQWLPLRPRAWFVVLAKLLTFVSVCVVAYYAAAMFQGTFHISSQTTGISTRWIKLSILVGMVLMAIFALHCVSLDLRRILRGDFAYFASYGEVAAVGDAPRSAIDR
jgi:TRAP-type C4-dicarboxylate transport system permease small subunit